MNKEDNEETKEQNNPININKGETEDIEIEQNIEPSKQVQQLKEVAALNTSIRAWSGIPGKKQPIQAQIVDNTQK